METCPKFWAALPLIRQLALLNPFQSSWWPCTPSNFRLEEPREQSTHFRRQRHGLKTSQNVTTWLTQWKWSDAQTATCCQQFCVSPSSIHDPNEVSLDSANMKPFKPHTASLSYKWNTEISWCQFATFHLLHSWRPRGKGVSTKVSVLVPNTLV